MTYVDDVICFSSNMAEHLIHLDEICQRFRAAKLRLNPKKCKFSLSEIKFLGHVVNKNGISIDHSKDAAILGIPETQKCQTGASIPWSHGVLETLYPGLC